jgi:hypothetical protein
MNAKRLTLILAPMLCIVLAPIILWRLGGGIPQSRTSGTLLSISTLADDEEVAVSYVFSHRNDFARQYYVRRSSGLLTLAIFSGAITWRDEGASIKPDQLLATVDLSPTEAQGLDALLAYFRREREEHSSAYKRYHIVHLRSGKTIGEEHFVGFSLPGKIDYLESNHSRTDPAYSSDLDRLAADHGLTRADLDRIVPFERLTRRATGNR